MFGEEEYGRTDGRTGERLEAGEPASVAVLVKQRVNVAWAQWPLQGWRGGGRGRRFKFPARERTGGVEGRERRGAALPLAW